MCFGGNSSGPVIAEGGWQFGPRGPLARSELIRLVHRPGGSAGAPVLVFYRFFNWTSGFVPRGLGTGTSRGRHPQQRAGLRTPPPVLSRSSCTSCRPSATEANCSTNVRVCQTWMARWRVRFCGNSSCPLIANYFMACADSRPAQDSAPGNPRVRRTMGFRFAGLLARAVPFCGLLLAPVVIQ
jgi:hypothetical protein